MIRKQQYVRKSISNMTDGYDYYDTEILLNGIPVGGLSQHGYLETAGFKLAHLWGFLWGNAFFPEVVPGYTPDTALTARYVQMVSMDIGFPIRVLT